MCKAKLLYTFIMEKDLKIAELYTEYKELLTPHQSRLVNLYYECDLSLGEIADVENTSRQSVNDALRKARDFLTETEQKLRYAEKKAKLRKAALSVLEGVSDGKTLAETVLEEL